MKKTIIVTTGLYPSEGIFSFIKYISVALISNKEFLKKYNLKILVFNEGIKNKTKKIIYNSFLIIKNILLTKKNRIHQFNYSAKKFKQENRDLSKFIEYFNDESDYEKYDPHLIFPMQTNVDKKILSLGYIYDLQHKELPHLFDKKEIRIRNRLFKNIIKNNNKIILNSKYVKDGLIKTYKVENKKIIQLPFLPYIFDNVNFLKKNIKKRYGISDDYFFIGNNFWKHKNHEVAFKAFEIFLEKNPKYQLICTGKTHDSRFPNYFKNLTKNFEVLIKNGRLKILNLIPRTDQLSLMKNSIAVVQPTLYEGGPGGFSTYEALAIGKKVIISDIPINKEINSNNLYFFNPNLPSDLAKIFMKLIKIRKSLRINVRYKSISEGNKKKFGKFLYKIINKS